MANFLELARKESLKSEAKTYQFGCVIARGNRVLSKAFNSYKTHPQGSGVFSSLHAEARAILKAKQKGVDITGATIYIWRKNEAPGKPCPDCEKKIIESGIKKIIFTVESEVTQSMIA